jgi:SSS family solute:Na+ symporter
MDLNASKMEMGRPATDDAMPWTILIMGIWIPNFYYWGLNQYITQRILGSGSLAEGQKGIVLAAGLKLIIPFIIVIPGIIAFNLYAGDMAGDTAKKMVEAVEKGEYKDNELVLFYSTKADPATAKMSEEAIREKLDDTVEAKIDEHNAPLLERIKTKGETTIENIKAWDAQGKKGEIELDDGSSIKIVENTYKYDSALGNLMRKISETPGVLGFVLAALLGAIVSSLAAVLNAISTLFTMDVFQRYVKPDAKPSLLVFTGRVVTVVLTVVGCVAASMLNSDSIFGYIQKVQCYVSPAIFAVFVFGILNRSANRWAGLFGLIIGPVLFTVFDVWGWDIFPVCIREMMAPWGLGVPVEGGAMHYLNAASWTLVLTLILLYVYSLIFKMPKQDKVEFQSNTTLDMTMSKGALIAGIIVCVLTVALYVFFW